MDERVRFVSRVLDGESMTALCEEFGISRKTGYKIFQRTSRLAGAGSVIGAAGRTGTRISCPRPSKH